MQPELTFANICRQNGYLLLKTYRSQIQNFQIVRLFADLELVGVRCWHRHFLPKPYTLLAGNANSITLNPSLKQLLYLPYFISLPYFIILGVNSTQLYSTLSHIGVNGAIINMINMIRTINLFVTFTVTKQKKDKKFGITCYCPVTSYLKIPG